MIRFNLKKLIEDKEFHEDRRVTIMEIAEETGISRNTLSKIINQRGYDTSVGNLENYASSGLFLIDFYGTTH